ncbi:MAG: glutathione S-transferase C-terminal domain-containing protein [Myxococcota bacterium]
MSRMVDGVWAFGWEPTDQESGGKFVRKASVFRDWLPEGEPIAPGRYHLYVAWTCPWAHRTLLVRSLKGLQAQIPVHFCNTLSSKSWQFTDAEDGLYGADYLYEIYLKADPSYTGRVTVPTLWDSVEETIVNNESSEIIRMLDAIPSDAPRLSPPAWIEAIDAVGERMYHTLNNGVYRSGFARTQEAYDEAVQEVFATLDWLESELEGRTWLVGDRLTEADIRLFVTLMRFDAAYYTLFKCNLKRIAEYSNLQAHTMRMWHHPGVQESCNIEAMRHGYASIKAINPYRIVPVGPPLAF